MALPWVSEKYAYGSDMVMFSPLSEMMDFVQPDNEICFAPSIDVGEVIVSIIADDFEGSSEFFLLQLSSRPVAYPIQVKFPTARSVTTITIVENPGM